MEKPLVSICCLAYNHEPFLRECFEGFVMQKTTFPIEVLVHDDASTDHSVDIIREYTEKYPDIFKPYYQTENQYSKGKGFVGLNINLERAQGKYIAMCEGDDYWIDPLKLQKQVDFLEENEEYSLCCTSYAVYDQENKIWKQEYDNTILGKFTIKDWYNHWLIQNLTIVFRKDHLNVSKLLTYKKTRDYHIFYSLLKTGAGYKLNDCTSVYRMHNGGIHSKKDIVFQLKIDYEVVKDLYKKNKSDLHLKEQTIKYLNAFHHYTCIYINEKKLFACSLYILKEYIWLKGVLYAIGKYHVIFYPHIRDYIKKRFTNEKK